MVVLEVVLEINNGILTREFHMEDLQIIARESQYQFVGKLYKTSALINMCFNRDELVTIRAAWVDNFKANPLGELE